MSSPDLSVVMSVYNNADTLPAALDSVLVQTGVTFECIVIDDGSTDGSGRVLDERAQLDPRLRVEHRSNQGLTRALIRGCELARAPWVVRQDADDRSLPGRFAALLELARRNPEAVIVASSARYVGPEDEFLCDVIRNADPGTARRQLLDERTGPPAHGCVMFSLEAYRRVGGYRSCFYYGQDSDLWLRMAEIGGVVYDKEIFYEYRLSPGAISGAQRRKQKAFGELGQQCRAARRGGGDEEPFLQRAQALCQEVRSAPRKKGSSRDRWTSYYYTGSLLEQRDPVRAAHYFRQAVTCQPFAWKPWVKWLRCGRLR
jgi:glycosyltransferase involved in cell wall biosynthesis